MFNPLKNIDQIKKYLLTLQDSIAIACKQTDGQRQFHERQLAA